MLKLKGLLKRKVSLMLVGGSQDKLRQFRFSYGLILGATFFLTFLMTSNIILTTSFVKSKVADHEAERLRMENRHLISKYDELRRQVDQIELNYEDLVAKEVVIRDIFELPEISTDERQLGIGGPEGISPDQLTMALQVAHSTENEVETLLRLSNFEQEKYDEVYQKLLDKKNILDHTPSILPARGYWTRGYGMKHDPFTGYKRFHGGLDIANKTGTPVYSTADGVIKSVGRMSDIGKYIVIDHGHGYKTKYGHLSQIKVKRGQKIRRGDQIALMGSTGYSTGPHLHYEIIKNNKRVDPQIYILNR